MGVTPKKIRLADGEITLPVLPGPVGRPGPDYPGINRPESIALVDAQFALIAELRNAPLGPGGVTPQQLRMAIEVSGYRTNRAGAITGFQRTANVGTREERVAGVILPSGSTWEALYIHGQLAAKLDTLRDQRRNPQDYVYTGLFDHQLFLNESASRLRANPATAARYSPISRGNFDRMLTYMEQDPRLIDVRWMAYMFATAYWETARAVTVGLRPNGRPIRQFQTLAPVDETGSGKGYRYGRPVKVERLGVTKARITEWDGEQFEVNESGYTVPQGRRGGADYSKPAHRDYTSAAGREFVYHGRGYVQLTWWYNYAMASIAIGRGLALLWNPELAKNPDVAYFVMVDGMMTGRHYANRKMLQMYIAGATTNYAGAREIVNARDPQSAIVIAAEAFEAALLAARQ
ncbi:hypothetical protein DMC47_10630 [Nostoc sp. 3335mG]|nr:hypothetical protein DMC47_10630 [Nostoc sp. 3335mG]